MLAAPRQAIRRFWHLSIDRQAHNPMDDAGSWRRRPHHGLTRTSPNTPRKKRLDIFLAVVDARPTDTNRQPVPAIRLRSKVLSKHCRQAAYSCGV